MELETEYIGCTTKCETKGTEYFYKLLSTQNLNKIHKQNFAYYVFS